MSNKPFSETIHNDVKDFFNQIFLEDLQNLHENMSKEIKTLNEKYNKIVTDIEEDYKRATEIKQTFLNAIDPLSDHDSSLFKQITEVREATQAIKPAVDTIDSAIKYGLNQITITSGNSVSFAEYAALTHSVLEKVKEEVSVINGITRTTLLRGENEDVSIYGELGAISIKINDLCANSKAILKNLVSIIEVNQRALTNEDGATLSLFTEFERQDNNLSIITTAVGTIKDYLDNNPIMPYDHLKAFLNEITIKQNKIKTFVSYSVLLQFVTIISIALAFFLK